MQREHAESLRHAGALPSRVEFRFDPANEDNSHEDGAGKVLKTRQRIVTSLDHGHIQAREVVRQQRNATVSICSPRLNALVPRGAQYGYDLITYVGIQTLLRGQSLSEVHQDLSGRQPSISVSTSTLWDQQQKFLYYLGLVNQQAVSKVRDYLTANKPSTWLIDGTVEPGTSVFLGIQDADSGIFLSGSKIASENKDDISACLAKAKDLHGAPDRILHDLCSAMSEACEKVFPEVPHDICHFHLVRDVGEDLCDKPQTELVKQMRAIKTQNRMKEQRQGQTAWLRERLSSSSQLILSQLLSGQSVNTPLNDTLGREVLLAFHFWILDYRSDGKRRGYPFDPYMLFLHRRLTRAKEAVDRLMERKSVAKRLPRVLHNFQKRLNEYCSNSDLLNAADAFERSYAMLNRLRAALHFTEEEAKNLRQTYDLAANDREGIKKKLQELRRALRKESADEDNPDRQRASIVLNHLDTYWDSLFTYVGGERWHRTTNQLESSWSSLKRMRRRTHGRGKLTRDFIAMPAEYLLLLNLENPTYIDIALDGSLDNLADKFAEVSQNAAPFSAWRVTTKPHPIGMLSRKLLRNDEFIDQLVNLCHKQPSFETAEAA